ncbi:MAG TPA: AAA family ATPase, partial [Lentisphaeria bacterium]|nr:AAA family ATPase [Lentisphaeria bacterium]
GIHVSDEAIHAANSYFSAKPFAEDHQQRAAALALDRHFAIITGGPGTGKTTVLVTILALELARQPDLRIALAAPTGKAAARMTAAIAEEIHAGRLLTISDANAEKLASLSAKTIHAMIGAAAPGRKPRFNRENQLACDLAVIDEASMASLPIMARLLDALPPSCRLLLLGDKDQLTSVEAGSVLADLCTNPELKNHVAYLTHNYRSAENTVLCDFVKTIAAQESLPDLEDLYSKRHPHFQARSLPDDSRREALKQALTTTLETMLTDGFSLSEWQNLPSLERAFEYSEYFKILTALRDGPFGVINLNRLMADILSLPLYANGAPVLVLANDYVTDLRNGDLGICWDNQVYFARPPDPEAPEGSRYAAFSRI